VFVWWCARQAGVQESIIHKTEWAKTRLQPFASLPFEQCGTIRPGDIAFIDTSGGTGRETHVGIIAEVSSDRITVVEGNSGDKVVTHSYSRGSGSCLTASSSTCILFVGSPDYNGVNSAHASYSTALAYAPGTQAYSSPNGSRTEKLGSREYMILSGDLSGEWIQIVAEDGLGSWFIPSEGVTIIERDLPPITGYDAWGGYSVPAATTTATTAAATTTTIAATTTTASSTAATDTEITVGDHPSGEEMQTTVPTGIHTEPTHPEHSGDDSRPSADSGGSKWTSVAIFSLIGVACLGILACVGGNSRRRKTR